MKTAITVVNDVQISMDEWKAVKTTKIFENTSTIQEIKEWIQSATKSKCAIDDISISCVTISDVI